MQSYLKADSQTVQGTRGEGLDSLPFSRRLWGSTGRRKERQVSAWSVHEEKHSRAAIDSRTIAEIR